MSLWDSRAYPSLPFETRCRLCCVNKIYSRCMCLFGVCGVSIPCTLFEGSFYVVRPGDAPEGKGPQFQPFWDSLMTYNLRGGFAMQLCGYVLVIISSFLGGNLFQIFGVLAGHHVALQNVPVVVAFMGMFFWTFGAVWIQNFRSIADDDASIRQSRGFRAGIKCLHQASMLDILALTMTTMLLFSFMEYFEDAWAAKKVGSGSTAIYASVARTLHALGLMLYAASFFLLENFHVEGTAEFWGWLLAVLFKIAGVFELLTLISTNDVCAIIADICFTLTLGLALVSAFLWSLTFEATVNQSDVKLTQSAMRNEFYKSRNAMAYYGPPAGVELAAPEHF